MRVYKYDHRDCTLAIIVFVQNNPCTSAGEISKYIGFTYKKVQLQVRKLVTKGILVRVLCGRKSNCAMRLFTKGQLSFRKELS